MQSGSWGPILSQGSEADISKRDAGRHAAKVADLRQPRRGTSAAHVQLAGVEASLVVGAAAQAVLMYGSGWNRTDGPIAKRPSGGASPIEVQAEVERSGAPATETPIHPDQGVRTSATARGRTEVETATSEAEFVARLASAPRSRRRCLPMLVR